MPEAEDKLIYACGGEIDTGEFSLVITSDDLNPSEITKLLGIQPTDSHRRGDYNQTGKVQFKFGRWQFSTSRLDFRAGPSWCLKSFDEFVRSLPDVPATWSRIAREHDAQIFIHLWMKTWNREFDLSAFALGELARRHLSLHIDTYFVADKDE
jgi:hypothetical protein